MKGNGVGGTGLQVALRSGGGGGGCRLGRLPPGVPTTEKRSTMEATRRS